MDLLFEVQKNPKKSENVNPKVSKTKTKNDKTMLSSKCDICGSRKSRLMKERETKGLLSSLGIE